MLFCYSACIGAILHQRIFELHPKAVDTALSPDRAGGELHNLERGRRRPRFKHFIWRKNIYTRKMGLKVIYIISN